MTPASAAVLNRVELDVPAIRGKIEREIETLLAGLPAPESLSPAQRREIIARYTSVLEGNFIYWMTGAFIAAKSAPAREKILENLLEEVRDSHPNMMRKFAIAAGAVPTDRDAAVVFEPLTAVRLFIGRLSPVPILTTMAFFEGFIQRFMPYLADLAARQGSTEMEYTDVHGVCDVTHTEELYKALGTEVELSNGAAAKDDLFEGVRLLRSLIETIVVA